ncbi:MAG: PEPxxWA-CTERM sorting domain-containing protein, partial [Pseudomonadota bacterium]
QWDVTGGSVDLVGGNIPGVLGAPPDMPDGRYVDLGGSTGNPGRFETRLAYPVTAGTSYNLTFDYRSTGGDLNAAQAFVGDQVFSVSRADPTFTRFSQDFIFSDQFIASSGGMARIAFQGAEGDLDGSGIGIDGVLFGPNLVAAVPEPGSWAMMIIGFGLAGGALRRGTRGRRSLAVI